MAKPRLIILAGPNGAGKSTFAENSDLKFISELGINSFDYDLEFKKLYDKFSSIMNTQLEENLSVRAKEIFEERAIEALQDKRHFSFQTNYDKGYTEEWRARFANAGFDTELYFLYVDEVDLCISRVAKRVREGGHNVPVDEIRSRFTKGLKNLDNTIGDFNKVVIINTSEKTNRLLYECTNDQINFVEPSYIDMLFKYSLEKTKLWLMERLKQK